MTSKNLLTRAAVADVLGVTKRTLETWEKNGRLVPHTNSNGTTFYHLEQLDGFEQFSRMENSTWDDELAVTPKREYTSIELFSGAGGLALGLEICRLTE